MRIAFVSEHPANDVGAFSGIPHFMFRHLGERHAIDCHIHSPMIDLEEMLARPEVGIRRLEEAGQEVSRRLRHSRADVVICQGSSMLPFLETEKPVVLWHDSTWQSLLQVSNDEFQHCHPGLREWDRLVLQKCDIVAFAADWVREATLRHHQVDPEMLAVVPFGPSLDPPSADAVEETIRRRSPRPCQLTFIGVDWARKGLPLAYSVASALNRAGVHTVLNIVGTDLQPGPAWDPARPFQEADLTRLRIRSDPDVRVWGFLSKDSTSERHTFEEILGASHFLLHPAAFECYGVALVEAGTLGVPVLATDQFGPRTIVSDGINGHSFPPADYVSKAPEFIRSHLDPYSTYQAAARSAYADTQDRLSWPHAVDRLTELVALLVERRTERSRR